MDRTLKELKIGQSAYISRVLGEGALRQHLLDMGIIPGTKVTAVKLAPMGDPIEIRLYDYELTLRMSEAENIIITEDKASINMAEGDDPAQAEEESREEYREHPGFGEKKHTEGKKKKEPVLQGKTLRFALVGNQKSGKTTLFNALTGMNQHVGNFPGVTVDRKDGVIKGYPDTVITDLPGIYSMSPYTSEEIVSRNFVLKGNIDAIINIVDATNMERNLYLTLQLLELNIPMVVALNMMDELRANSGTVDVNALEALLGVPVVPISAAKEQGIRELTEHAVSVASYREKPAEKDFCEKNLEGGAIHRCIHAIIYFIEDHAERCSLPVRFASCKLIENDTLITKELALDKNESETIEHMVSQMEAECGLDRNAAIARMRFSFIQRVCKETVIKPKESKEARRSRKIDEALTGKWTAIPAFIGIMLLVFYLSFNVIGSILQNLLEGVVSGLTDTLEQALISANVHSFLRGLIIGGICEGVGSVLSFLPIIVTLFFFLSILEDTGYTARVAFVMDRLLRKVGLSGRSIVPMLIGFGCTVPAVMATRTLPSERDRRMTILLAPFMSCSAKLPIYAFFVNAFFPGRGGLIMIALYLTGILFGIIVAFIYRNTLFKGEAVPFVMELPNYRLPKPSNIGKLLWNKVKDFLERAFSVILIASIIIWILKNIDFTFNVVSNPEASILAGLSGYLAMIMAPLGLNDWRICTAFISGFLAKESVVSTLQVLFEGDVTRYMTSLQALSALVFSLLYTPCIAAVAAIRRELGRKWAVGVIFWQCLVAWAAACIVYQAGCLICRL